MPDQPKLLALVSDLDDTLLNEHHQMTDRTVAALRRLLSMGVKVILASGRSAASVRAFVKQVGTPWPYIGANGAQIMSAETHLPLALDEVPLDLARETLRWFEARGVYIQYYKGDDWFFEKRNRISDDYGLSTGILGTELGKPLSACIQYDTPKLLAIEDAANVPALRAEAQRVFGERLSITTSKPNFIEITSPTATKGNAVRKLAGMIGLTPETTACAGDSLNDLTMLAWSKWPLSVENARDEVKGVAWRVGGHASRDGMAALLDEIFPEGQTC